MIFRCAARQNGNIENHALCVMRGSEFRPACHFIVFASRKLFRVVYSPRLSNQKSVRELSISSFLRDTPVLDWIAHSYTPQMCFDYLDQFVLRVDPANLQNEINSVKKRFVLDVCKFFTLKVDPNELAEQFSQKLDQEIKGFTLESLVNVE